MLITRLELENIKSYRHCVIDFRRGTTAISGANGTGKTTLVEAIGFALFGYLPYSHDQFVREGEKQGKVVVHLVGSDDRPYTVERRCGSGARWLIHDQEANLRLEQRADVLDRLHDLFGIDRERPLDSLFRDALGVPQGTFTAIFLEVPSKRKQTFDALLQIEDYKTAADNLLETQRLYKEQMQEQQAQINHLTFITSDLEQWRNQLKDARLLDEQQKAQNAQWTQQLADNELRARALNEQALQVKNLEQQYTAAQSTAKHVKDLLREREQQLQAARNAQQIVLASQEDHRRYLQAQATLKRLQQDSQQRAALLKQQAERKNMFTRSETQAKGWLARLAEVAAARQKIVALAPLVDQQIDLEKQRDQTMQKVTRYQEIVTLGKRLSSQFTKCQQELEKCQRAIAEIEPLQPLADALQTRGDLFTQLRIQASERSNKLRSLQEKQNLLREKQRERDQVAENLRKAEHNLAVIEEHRQEAEEMPSLQDQLIELAAQKNRLEGSIAGNVKAREQSAGGQCPLLRESCLNIKRLGIISLESYFDTVLKDEYAQLERVTQEQETINTRIGQIKKYADALAKIGQYTEKRDSQADLLQRYAIENTRLEREVATLQQDLESLKQVDQQLREAEAAYNESKKADLKVRELVGLRKQVQQLQDQARQLEADLQERRQEAAQLQSCGAQLKQIEAQLATLNDPRAQSKAQQDIIAQEDLYQQHLQQEQQRQQEIQKQLHDLEVQLAVYESLDADMNEQNNILQQTENGFQRYMHHQKEAQTLPAREQAYQQQLETSRQVEQQLQAAEQAYRTAYAAFDQLELTRVQAEINRLGKELRALAERMQRHQQDINDLEQKIAEGEAHLLELEAAQHEYQTLEDLHGMTEHFRKLIKEAAPHVLKAMLNDISAEANRIFGEIMGDRSASLSWRNEYEIILRRQGADRTFAQLSGGEQMSAALSVRLALLKKLSTLNIAFFDEPTQNMDELRRMNLAEQIRRVRGFDQLIVISHDDTFEQGLDSLVRLEKVHGETRQLSDDNALPSIHLSEFQPGAQRAEPPAGVWGVPT